MSAPTNVQLNEDGDPIFRVSLCFDIFRLMECHLHTTALLYAMSGSSCLSCHLHGLSYFIQFMSVIYFADATELAH